MKRAREFLLLVALLVSALAILSGGRTAATGAVFVDNAPVGGNTFTTANCFSRWWWNGAYRYRQRVTVTTGTAAVTSGYSVQLNLNHAQLVQQGKSLASGDDLRLLYWNQGNCNWSELDRVLGDGSSWNSTTTRFWFKLQNGIAANSSDDNYYVYYGNASATNPPANRSNVYLFWDDFESYSLGSNGSPNWSPGAACWSVVDDGGNKVYRGSSSGRCGSMVSGVWIENAVYEARYKRVTTDSNDSGLPFRATDLSVSAIDTYVAQLRGNENVAAIVEYNTGSWGGILNSTSFTVTVGQWYNLRVRYMGTNFELFVDDVLRVTASDPTKTIGGVGVFVWNGRGYFDDVKTRKYTQPEPTVSVGAEESAP